MRRTTRCAWGLALAVSASAWAQVGGSWTEGGMLGAGKQALDAQIGWPGVSLGYLAGLSDRFDLGGHFAFDYALEGDPRIIAPGIKLAADLKLKLTGGEKVTLLMAFAPGFTAYFNYGDGNANGTLVMVSIPVSLVAGFHLAPAFLLDASLSFPMGFGVLSSQGVGFGYFQFPIVIGVGAEYLIDQRLSLTFDVRGGPFIAGVAGATGTDGTFDVLFGVTYRM